MYIFIFVIILTHLEICHAVHRCACNCYIFKMSGDDAPKSVWKKMKPERIERDRCIEVKFVSSEPNSHVCLLQLQNISSIGDQNLELTAMDGTKEVFSLSHSSRWVKREYCSSSDSLSFQLKRLDGQTHPQLDLVHADLRIMHMESRSRKIYMSENYCDETFLFRNSVVRIFNVFPYATQGSPSQYCSVNLFKAANQPTQFCLFYTVLHPRNVSEVTWKLYVTTTDHSSDPRDALYTLEANMSETGAWCDTRRMQSIMVTYYEAVSDDPMLDPPDITIIVADYSGGLENFTENIDVIAATTTPSLSTLDEATMVFAASATTPTGVPHDHLTTKHADTPFHSSTNSGSRRPEDVSFTTPEYQRPTMGGDIHPTVSSRPDLSTSMPSTSSTTSSDRYLIPKEYTFKLFIYILVLGSAILVVMCALICFLKCQKRGTKKIDRKLKPNPLETPKGKK